MSKLLNEVKYRWTMAPMWVKILDTICWGGLIIILGLVFI